MNATPAQQVSCWTGYCLVLFGLIAAAPVLVLAGTNDHNLEGCLDWRWVGLRNSDVYECPTAPGWEVESLFTSHAAGMAPSLEDYCLYTASKGGGHTHFLELLLNGELQQLDRDCVVVSSQTGGALADLHWPALEQQFLDQAGAVDSGLLGPNSVELVVVDTNPNNDVDPIAELGNADHGHALLNMADRLLCADTTNTCSVDINSRLAFRFLNVDSSSESASVVDDQAGGYNSGSLVDLARAIQIEVRDWADSANAQRLVINLSLGWNPAFGGLEMPLNAMPLGPKAVYAALYDARCRGALVFAAAGNRDGANSPQTGPLLPGGWETRAAPPRAECDDALGISGTANPRDFDPSDYRPLLYSIGGVEANGTTLGNARPNSASRLAAFADHATVASLTTGQPATAILTGSSVSTLLASINATMIWSWRSVWRPEEVVAAIYDAGQGLGRQADVCLGPVTNNTCSKLVDREVHRFSLCETRAEVAPGKPFQPGSCSWNTEAVSLTADYTDFDFGAHEIDLADLDQAAFKTGCRGLQILHDGSAGGNFGIACPQILLPSMADQPWLLPQPGSSLCPECPLDSSANLAKQSSAQTLKSSLAGTTALALRIEIHPQFLGSVNDVTLSHDGTLYRLHGSPMSAGDRLVVRGLEMIPDLDGAAISFSVNDTLSNTVPILRSD